MHPRPRHRIPSRRLMAAALLACSAATAWAATPAELQRAYAAQAASPSDAPRGQAFFTQTHGHEWSCSTCHGKTPTQGGRHASTGKAIAPLAPAFSAERFTDAAKVEKWFRRNCKDVTGRECTAAEKADVLAWLLTLQP